MNIKEYYEQLNTMTRDQKKMCAEIYKTYENEVLEICKANIKNFNKLTETQNSKIYKLAFKMFTNYLTDEYIANHYEIFASQSAGDNKYKEYRDMEERNIYLASGSSSTFRALEKKGFIKVIEDGKSDIDSISPNFKLNFTGIQLKECFEVI